MRRRLLATRRQVLTAAGAAAALPLTALHSTPAEASDTPSAQVDEPECLADLVATGVVTRADFLAS